MTGTLKLWEVN